MSTCNPIASYPDVADQPEEIHCMSDRKSSANTTTSRTMLTTSNEAMWALHNGSNYFPCERSVEFLPPGQYTIQTNDGQVYFCANTVQLDELYNFPDSAFADVVSDIEIFWSREQNFRDFNFLWKRGILLYGPPGSGKSSLVQIVAQLIIDRGGIVISGTDPYRLANGLRLLRKIEPIRPIVILIEDIDAVIRNDESGLLALLDGELQVDNIVTIATTNYPERLDRRLINRPSRFDIVKKIGMPSAAARAIYLQHKNPELKGPRLDRWIVASEGYSMAHLKELIVSIECLGCDFDSTVNRLNGMIAAEPNSAEYDYSENKVFGFTGGATAMKAYK